MFFTKYLEFWPREAFLAYGVDAFADNHINDGCDPYHVDPLDDIVSRAIDPKIDIAQLL